MKYYAVTNDPAELMHYGVKGMKWGVIRSDAQLGHPRKPRSAAYKKAQSKLGGIVRSGIKKAKANWAEYNSPENKEARFMKKSIQKAREGRLKYGKLTDRQVMEVTNRLALEQQARRLGSTENPSFGKRMRASMAEGLIEGAGRGTAEYMVARWKGRGQTTANIKADKRMARYESNKFVQRRKAKNEARQEYYRQQAEAGEPMTRTGTLVRMGLKNAYYNGREMAAEHDGDRAELARLQAERGLYNRQTAMNLLGSGGRAAVVRQRKAENQRLERQKRQQQIRDNAYYAAYGKQEAARLSGPKAKTPEPIIKVRDPRITKTGSSVTGYTINPHLRSVTRKKRYVRFD